MTISFQKEENSVNYWHVSNEEFNFPLLENIPQKDLRVVFDTPVGIITKFSLSYKDPKVSRRIKIYRQEGSLYTICGLNKKRITFNIRNSLLADYFDDKANNSFYLHGVEFAI